MDIALKRLNGPPLVVSEAKPEVRAVAPVANVRSPETLALKRGERSLAVIRAIVSAAIAKATHSETRLRVLPYGMVKAARPTTTRAMTLGTQPHFRSTFPLSRACMADDLVIGWIPGMKFRCRVSYQAHTGRAPGTNRKVDDNPGRTADTGSCPRLPFDGATEK